MPLVGFPVDRLLAAIGRPLDRDELTTVLERLGSDVEEFSVVSRYLCDVCGHLTEVLEHEPFNGSCANCSGTGLVPQGCVEVVRINLLPARPDLFDIYGLARALRGFLGIETGLVNYSFQSSGYTCRVEPSLQEIRPWIACCVARHIVLDGDTLRGLMKLQENLHWALGRDRRRASIGVYDLDTLQPDFLYCSVLPDEVEFTPLSATSPMSPRRILELHPKGITYAHLLSGVNRYPLLRDSSGRVLSMPPIINSNETRVTTQTRNLFVDVTGPDRTAVHKTLAVLASTLHDAGAEVQTVLISYPDHQETTPDMAPTKMKVSVVSASRLLGVELNSAAVPEILRRVRFGVPSDHSTQLLEVLVPAYRCDIMHECDLIEEIGVGYGFHRIAGQAYTTQRLAFTVGKPLPKEEFAEVCRTVLTGLGFLETMSLMLVNPQSHFVRLRQHKYPDRPRIQNPVSSEQTELRAHLLSGLLETLGLNSDARMPQYIFEIGDCFELDPIAETGVRTSQKLAIAMTGPSVSFASCRSVLEALALELGLVLQLAPVENPLFISGRGATILATPDSNPHAAIQWGIAGELHPEIIASFGVKLPVAIAEVSLEL